MPGEFPRPSAAPKVLLISVLPYMLSARLALSLRAVGCEVEAVCPSRHPVRVLKAPPRIWRLGPLGATSIGRWGAAGRVARAIERSAAELVIPCDDQALGILSRLSRRCSSPTVRSVLARSLGEEAGRRLVESKSAQVALARAMGVATPASRAANSPDDLERSMAETRFPAFVKQDATWAGMGVSRADTPEQARAIWRRMSGSHTAAAVLRKAPVFGWRFALASFRTRPAAIDIQELVRGGPANRAVVCRDGQVVAGLSVVAVKTASPTGPATVVRRTDNPQMTDIAERMVRRLGLSGFVGFDFVLDEGGDAHFLEINPRPTPICALALDGADDLAAAFVGAFFDRTPWARPRIVADTVAMFPGELGRDPTSSHLVEGFHDIPEDEEELVAFGRGEAGLGAGLPSQPARRRDLRAGRAPKAAFST